MVMAEGLHRLDVCYRLLSILQQLKMRKLWQYLVLVPGAAQDDCQLSVPLDLPLELPLRWLPLRYLSLRAPPLRLWLSCDGNRDGCRLL